MVTWRLLFGGLQCRRLGVSSALGRSLFGAGQSRPAVTHQWLPMFSELLTTSRESTSAASNRRQVAALGCSRWPAWELWTWCVSLQRAKCAGERATGLYEVRDAGGEERWGSDLWCFGEVNCVFLVALWILAASVQCFLLRIFLGGGMELLLGFPWFRLPLACGFLRPPLLISIHMCMALCINFFYCRISCLMFNLVCVAGSHVRGTLLRLGHCWPNLLVLSVLGLAFVGRGGCCLLGSVCREVIAPAVDPEVSLHSVYGVRSSIR